MVASGVVGWVAWFIVLWRFPEAAVPFMGVWAGVFLLDMIWLARFRCPRCHRRFFVRWSGIRPFTQHCLHCGLPAYADDAQIAARVGR